MSVILFNADVAVEQFKKRAALNKSKEKIDNSKLYAGSPMYYYCKHCGVQTEVLPESHVSRPKTVCTPCEALVAHGLLPLKNEPLDRREKPKKRK